MLFQQNEASRRATTCLFLAELTLRLPGNRRSPSPTSRKAAKWRSLELAHRNVPSGQDSACSLRNHTPTDSQPQPNMSLSCCPMRLAPFIATLVRSTKVPGRGESTVISDGGGQSRNILPLYIVSPIEQHIKFLPRQSGLPKSPNFTGLLDDC